MVLSRMYFLAILVFFLERSSPHNTSADVSTIPPTAAPASTVPNLTTFPPSRPDHSVENDISPDGTEVTNSSILPDLELRFGPIAPNYTRLPMPIKYKFRNYTTQMTVEQQKFVVRQALRAWESVADVRFQEVENDTEKVAVGYFNDPSTPYIGVAVFRTNPWELQINDGKVLEPHVPHGKLYRTVLHEIGHFLGLTHTDVANCSMVPVLTHATSSLCEDDIAGARFVYGMRNENEEDDRCHPDGPPSEYIISNRYSGYLLHFPPLPNPRVLNTRINLGRDNQKVIFEERVAYPVRALSISNPATNRSLSLSTRGHAEQRPFTHNNESQMFEVFTDKEGYCKLQSIANSLFVAVSNNNTQDSRVYLERAQNGSRSQQWQIRRWPGSLCRPQIAVHYYKITNPYNGTHLHIPSNSTSPPGTLHDPWIFDRIGDNYILSKVFDRSRVLEMDVEGQKEEYPLRFMPYNASANQHWRLRRVPDTNYCSILTTHILHGDFSVTVSHGQVVASQPMLHKNQQWELTFMH